MTSKNAPPYPQIFTSYDRALECCLTGSYQYPNLVNVVIEKNKIFKEKLAQSPEFDLGSMRAVMAVGLSLTGKKISVTDFGGGGGSHYQIARKSFNKSIAFDWRVVETPSMADAANKAISADGLKFFNDIRSSVLEASPCDLLIASSALQYCHSPANTLRDLVGLGARYLFITRTPFSLGAQTLISTQRSMLSENGPGAMPPGYVDEIIEYPITYIPKFEAEEIILSQYKIIFSLIEEPASLFFDNLAVNNYYGFFCERK